MQSIDIGTDIDIDIDIDINTIMGSFDEDAFTSSGADHLACESGCAKSEFMYHVSDREALQVALSSTPESPRDMEVLFSYVNDQRNTRPHQLAVGSTVDTPVIDFDGLEAFQVTLDEGPALNPTTELAMDVETLFNFVSDERNVPSLPLMVLPTNNTLLSDSDESSILTDSYEALVPLTTEFSGDSDISELDEDDDELTQTHQSTEIDHNPIAVAGNVPTVAPLQHNTNGWTPEEHERYLRGLEEHPRVRGKWCWTAIARVVGTRSARQVQSHHQKVLAKLKKRPMPIPSRIRHELAPDVVSIAKTLTNTASRSQLQTPSFHEVPTTPRGTDATRTTEPEQDLRHPGSWSVQEHARYLDAVRIFAPSTPGDRWPVTKMAAYIGTRTTRQVQSHHQKYLLKCKRLNPEDPNAFERRREHRVDGVEVLLLG
ncbi:hypothetical protein PINS_up000691 [Pythium insidiosum]|nr:hypothetical protein PINS_up000691 [Pythium insidiosum]